MNTRTSGELAGREGAVRRGILVSLPPVLLLLALLVGETLTGIYVDNDIVNVGPLTDLTPAPIANASLSDFVRQIRGQ